VMVGDAAQAIYSFRGSTNALTLFEADERLPLTRSFRFGRGIAQLANALLGHFRHGFDQPLVGAGAPQRTRFTVDTGKAFAVIARTNAVVFEEAVAFLDLNRRFHFVGGTEGYKLEKALDAYRLWVGERGLVRDPYLRSFGSFDELVGLADDSEEPELRQLVRVVCDYGHQIPRLIEDIRSRHTDVPKHAWADFDGIYFCTAHKAKGLEFEQVWLADDFMRFFENGCELRPDQVDQEEVNILYVALTRARAAIRLNESFDDWLRHRRLLPG
jgi:F-box protein 18 (helicase)